MWVTGVQTCALPISAREQLVEVADDRQPPRTGREARYARVAAAAALLQFEEQEREKESQKDEGPAGDLLHQGHAAVRTQSFRLWSDMMEVEGLRRS